jgi:anaerobic ribonucleoside-triphosphate reductase activating protein
MGMNYANIKYCDIANGTGVRTTVFVSGCRLHCPGCFNAEAWDFQAGSPFDETIEAQVLDSLEAAYVEGLSVLGGEPTEPENQPGVAELFEAVRKRFGHTKDIWMYTGRVLEDLLPGGSHAIDGVTPRILGNLDVLVDGPFVEDQHDISLRFRGSSNQRLIDMPKTLAAGRVVLWEDEPIFSTHTI